MCKPDKLCYPRNKTGDDHVVDWIEDPNDPKLKVPYHCTARYRDMLKEIHELRAEKANLKRKVHVLEKARLAQDIGVISEP